MTLITTLGPAGARRVREALDTYAATMAVAHGIPPYAFRYRAEGALRGALSFADGWADYPLAGHGPLTRCLEELRQTAREALETLYAATRGAR